MRFLVLDGEQYVKDYNSDGQITSHVSSESYISQGDISLQKENFQCNILRTFYW